MQSWEEPGCLDPDLGGYDVGELQVLEGASERAGLQQAWKAACAGTWRDYSGRNRWRGRKEGGRAGGSRLAPSRVEVNREVLGGGRRNVGQEQGTGRGGQAKLNITTPAREARPSQFQSGCGNPQW